MTQQTLFLVHSTDDTISSLKSVFDVAGALQAYLDVLVLGAEPAAPSVMVSDTYNFDWNRMYRQLAEHAEQRRQEIETQLDNRGMAARVRTICQPWGQVSDTVARRALYADMMIMGEVGPKSAMSTHVLNGALFAAGQAVLVVPCHSARQAAFERILIAWAAGPQAARAVRASLPLLKTAEFVQIASVSAHDRQDAHETNTQQQSATRLQGFLLRHGVKSEIKLQPAHRDAAATIRQLADSAMADLVVMGAYGHSRFREWILGGTTRAMLDHAERPLLLAH